MSEDSDKEILERLLQGLDSVKRGEITRDEYRRMLLEEAGRLELKQWKIIEDLRTNSPEGQRDLAQGVAEILETELRKGHGNA